MGVRLRGASVRGPGHVRDGLPNQDALMLRRWHQSWFAAVSDGMGSRPCAAAGAQAVCQAVRLVLRGLPFDADDETLSRAIDGQWRTLLAGRRIAPADAVATCLLAWGLADGRFRLAQLGDGLILGRPAPATGLWVRDGSGFGNQTTGLGLEVGASAWCFAQGRLAAPGDGLVLMTDGISEDLGPTDGLVTAVVRSLRGRGARSGRALLTRELNDWPTRHHQDDKSVAIAYRH